MVGAAFTVPFLCYFQELFDALYFYLYELKNVFQIFKIFFNIGGGIRDTLL